MKASMRTLTAVPDRLGAMHVHTMPAGGWARVCRAAAELTPEAIEQIAQRVAAILREHAERASGHSTSGGLLDAAELARHLGVTRTWVYEHASKLGAIRLGDGAKARLRFDLDVATASFDQPGRRGTRFSASAPRPPRNRPMPTPATTPLLPISPQRTRGVLSCLVRARRRPGC
jgi:hypothetical protein